MQEIAGGHILQRSSEVVGFLPQKLADKSFPEYCQGD